MSDSKIYLRFNSLSMNESFARSVIACFALRLNPSLAEMDDIKTAVSEAVTNAIVHGYPDSKGDIVLEAETVGNTLHINIYDDGVGIKNIDEALEPFYSTAKKEEHSGLGFTIMQSFMDDVKVESKLGCGTKIFMKKQIKSVV